ncbi:MAG TPA: peptidoglycan-binding protein [Terriglobales bacterium]
MSLSRTLSSLTVLLFLGVSISVASTTAKKQTTDSVSTKAHTSSVSTKAHASHHSAHHKKSRRRRPRGQQAIDSARAREIQEALIREHYLKGEPTGKWDTKTQQAMQKYQGDQGWQTKTVPDSRALIRLGLGPDQEHLLNPESAMISGSSMSHTAPEPASRSAASSAASSMPAAQIATPAAVTPGPPAQ